MAFRGESAHAGKAPNEGRNALQADSIDSVRAVSERARMPVSEDVSYLITRVQEAGGNATFVGIGADHPSGHHTPRFDIDEDALQIGVDVLVESLKTLSESV